MTESDDTRGVGAAANVTTTIVRRIMPGRDDAFADWIQSGLGLARMFPGFLGGGWLLRFRFYDFGFAHVHDVRRQSLFGPLVCFKGAFKFH